jgi:3',5'-nucleoside bisphosphate phosphatase
MHADLHIHSRFSDGTYDPADLPRLARAHQLQAVALTDHDTVEGCAAAAAACHASGIDFITGVELTAEHDQHELHILGYGIDPQQPALLRELELFQRTRQQRIHYIVAKLNSLGIPLRAEAVFQVAQCLSPGRPHVGRALVLGGFCRSMDEAFDRFLKRGGPAWVPKQKVNAGDAIALIHGAGGAAVVAHPGLNRSDDALEHLAAQGLDGLECFHSKHSPHQCEHYLKLARQFGFLVTGGSDCHGKGHKRPTLGSVKLPWEQVELLRERCRLWQGPATVDDRLLADRTVLTPS